MGWRPLTERLGKQICEGHWLRHKDPNDSFNLWDAFGFRRPAGIQKPIVRGHLAGPAFAPPKPNEQVREEPKAEPEPPREKPNCHEPDQPPRLSTRVEAAGKPGPQTVPAIEKPSGCKACGAEREAGHSYCQECAQRRRKTTRRQAQSRYWRKQHISCGSD
jgi:hypothetical protein